MKETKNIEVVLQVKGNQKKLLKKCEEITKTKKPFSKAVQRGKKERGRIEKRTTAVFRKNKYDLGDTWNESIKTIIKIERNTKIFNTKTKHFEERGEIAFYISTTNKFSAKEFGVIVRSHWGIENSNHYVRDVSLREDFSRIRKNPEVMATIRSFGLNLLRVNREVNIGEAVYRNAVNLKRVLNYEGVKG